ncbi:Kv channel-interacting protein 1 [Balamuthia mandrillaris]
MCSSKRCNGVYEPNVKEFMIGLSTTTQGTVDEKLEWTFNLYDIDNNGYIEREEMLKIVTVYFRMCQSLMEEMPEEQNTPEKRTDHLFKQMDVNGDGKITLQEFKKGVKQDSAILGALTVLG